MKKQFLNLGKALNKAEQRQIKGGYSWFYCMTQSIDVVVFGATLIDGSIDTDAQWKECRAA
ncbi:MAG: hypothetical protein JJE44_10515 [Flavobacteriaceae bacterium]|nr:hypothetical protein [Flavobacteriaceae bacterium]